MKAHWGCCHPTTLYRSGIKKRGFPQSHASFDYDLPYYSGILAMEICGQTDIQCLDCLLSQSGLLGTKSDSCDFNSSPADTLLSKCASRAHDRPFVLSLSLFITAMQ